MKKLFKKIVVQQNVIEVNLLKFVFLSIKIMLSLLEIVFIKNSLNILNKDMGTIRLYYFYLTRF